MNTKFVLACALTGVVLVGCQSAEDQLGEKFAEGIINSATGGEVSVDIKDLEAGKIDIKTADGVMSIDGSEDGDGSFKMTDSSGKTLIDASSADNKITITDDTGKTVTATAGSSENRPAGVPEDLPSLPEASSFDFINVGEMESLSYSVGGTDAKVACEKQSALVEGAGWTVDPDFYLFESAESVLKSYLKDDKKMTLSCNVDSNLVNIVMSSNKNK